MAGDDLYAIEEYCREETGSSNVRSDVGCMSEKTGSPESGTDIVAGKTAERVFRPGSTNQQESISVGVVEALAEARGISPMEVDEPLYDAVDPEALDQIFDPNDDGGGHVVFTVGEHEVTVTAERDIYVRRRD